MSLRAKRGSVCSPRMSNYDKAIALREYLHRLPSLGAVEPRVTFMQAGANVGIFISAAQAQLLSSTLTNNETNLQVAVNVLGITGLILEVLGAFFLLIVSAMLHRNETHISLYLDDMKRRPVVELQLVMSQLNIPDIKQLTRKGTPSHRKTVIIRVVEILKEKDAWNSSRTDGRPSSESTQHTSPPSIEAALENITQSWDRDPDLYELIALSDQLHHAWVMGNRLDRWFFISVVVFLASVLCLAISTEHRQIWISSVVVFIFVMIFTAFLWLARLGPINRYPNTALFGNASMYMAWLWH